MEEQGLDTSLVEERMRNRSRSKSLADLKQKHEDDGDMLDEEEETGRKIRNRIREASRSRSKGYHREMSVAEVKGQKATNQLSKVWRTKDKKGESDRFVGTKMPKHLFTGKTGKGSRDWR